MYHLEDVKNKIKEKVSFIWCVNYIYISIYMLSVFFINLDYVRILRSQLTQLPSLSLSLEYFHAMLGKYLRVGDTFIGLKVQKFLQVYGQNQ